jgi:hypothetical protein
MENVTMIQMMPMLAEIAQEHGLRLTHLNEYHHALKIWANRYMNAPWEGEAEAEGMLVTEEPCA